MPAKYIYAFLRGKRLNSTAHSWQRQAGQYRKAYIAVCCSAAGNLGIFFLRLHSDSLPPTSKKAVKSYTEVKSPADRLFKVKPRTMYCWKTKIRSAFTEVSSPVSRPKQTQCYQYRHKPTLKLSNGILTNLECNLCDRTHTLLSSNGTSQPFFLELSARNY